MNQKTAIIIVLTVLATLALSTKLRQLPLLNKVPTV